MNPRQMYAAGWDVAEKVANERLYVDPMALMDLTDRRALLRREHDGETDEVRVSPSALLPLSQRPLIRKSSGGKELKIHVNPSGLLPLSRRSLIETEEE